MPRPARKIFRSHAQSRIASACVTLLASGAVFAGLAAGFSVAAVAATAQTITFTSTAPSGAVVGGPDYTVTATASSGLTVAFTLAGSSSGCTLSGSTVSLTGAGTCKINANQAGNATYSAAPQVQQTFTIKTPQTITFTSTPPSSAVVGGPDYTVTATGGASGNAVTFSLAGSSTGCTLVGSTVSLTAAGTCLINANQAGNSSFAAASQVQQSFVIKTPQTVSFTSTAPAAAVVGGASYTPTATASSGRTVAITLDASSAGCSLSAGVVSFTSTGTCVVDANQAGNASFAPASQVQQSFVVGKGAQAITFTSTAPASAVFGDGAYTVSATGNGATTKPITFSADAASVGCSVSGATVTITGAGTCIVDADQAGNGNYNPAPTAQQSFTIAKAAQTITFTSTPPAGAVFGDGAYTVSATASSGRPVSFSADALSNGCSVGGSTGSTTVTITGAGTCIIDADQAGNANYNAAPQVQQSFTIAKAAQTITFTSTAPAAAVVDGASYVVTATGGGSGKDVTFTADGTSNGCTVGTSSLSSATVTFTGAGTCIIDANQQGNGKYLAASQAQQSFSIGKGAQVITFTSTAPPAAVFGDGAYTVTATGGASGKPVTFSADATSVGCSVSGATVTITGAGTCVIDANQAGNGNYNPAPTAQQSFSIAKAAQTITFTSTPPAAAVFGDGAYTVSATASSGRPVSFSADALSNGCSVGGSTGSTTVTITGAGTCIIDADQAGNANYNAAPQVQQSFTIAKAPQAITFTSTPPAAAVFGDAPYTVTATGGGSGKPVTFTADGLSNGCSVSGSTVTITGAGTCIIDADQQGSGKYFAAPTAQQSFTIGKAAQAIVFTSTAPAAAVFGDAPYTVTATGGGSGKPVTFSADGLSNGCSVSGSTVTITGAGTCIIDADQAGNTNYNAAPQVQQSFTIAKAPQAITFTSTAPVGAIFGDAPYTVTATGGGSGKPVTFTADGLSNGCSVSGSTVTITGAGTCIIDADQQGSGKYLPAPTAQQSFTIAKAAQAISFTSSPPSAATFGDGDYTVTATGGGSGKPVTFTLDNQSSGCTILGSTISITGAGTCMINAHQAGNANYLAAPTVQQSFTIGKAAQAIVFTSTPPAAAVFGDAPYTVTATGGGSGKPVTFSADGLSNGCSVSGSTVTITGAGTCLIDADQAGNANYNAAPQVQQSFTIAKAPQAITFTSTPPAAAVFGDAPYTVTATGGGSGKPVTFTADGLSNGCSVSGSTVTITGAGTCIIDADQQGSGKYFAAPTAQQSFTIGKAAQAIVFTSTAPAAAVFGDAPYTVTATGGGSGKPVTFSADGLSNGCSVSGSTVTITGAGTCIIDADQAGNGKYFAAPTVQQSFTIAKAAQAISFTSTAPVGAIFGDPDYTVTATGGGSGKPVTFTLDNQSSGCTILGSTISITGAGTCLINAHQAGNANYLAAPTVQQSFIIGKAAQAITFTSTPPAAAVFGDAPYTVSATGGGSGKPVKFSLDALSNGCSISGATVTITGVGTCIIDANQASNANYNAAPQVQQSFDIGQAAQAIVFTSTPPAGAIFGDPDYTVTATGGASGKPVKFSLDPASDGCSLTAGVVSITGVGTCIINANQAGNANYSAAPTVQQSFVIAKAPQVIVFTSTAPVGAIYGGPDYTVTATGGASGKPVTFTLDNQSSGCTLVGSVVSMTAPGTCMINAHQAGSAKYLAAPTTQQSFTIAKAPQAIVFTSTAPVGAFYTGPSYTVAATGGASGKPVKFTLDAASAGCSIDHDLVSMTGVGTCIIDANQAGNSLYLAARQVQQSFVVSKAPQQVTFVTVAPTDVVFGDDEVYFPGAKGGPSGQPVIITLSGSSTGCTLVSGGVRIVSGGTCILNANQAGNSLYLAAPQVQQSFAIARAEQSINFSDLGTIAFGAPVPSLQGTSDSHLPVTYSASGPCSVSGGVLRVTGVGDCAVTARQAGDSRYLAADPVSVDLIVTKAGATLTQSPYSIRALVSGPSGTFTATLRSAINGSPISGVLVTFHFGGATGAVACSALTGPTGVATCQATRAVIYAGLAHNKSITATAPETANYLAATSVAPFAP